MHMTRNIGLSAGLLVLIVGAAVGCNSSQQGAAPGLFRSRTVDEPVTMDQVPAAVRQTIEANLKGGTVTEIERSRDGDQVTYEVEVTGVNGVFDMVVAEDGTFLGIEDDDED